MIRISVSLLVALLTAVTLGCGDSSGSENANPLNPTPNPGTPNQGSMTALIDGVAWSAGPGPAGCRLDGGLSQNGVLGLCGTDGRYQIGLGAPAAAGTYVLGVGAGSAGSAFVIQLPGGGSWGPTALQGSGRIVITSISATNVTGTFEFSGAAIVPPAIGVKTVTNGRFNLPICSGPTC
jgi:hypothetical protein